jgi:hypothetical protein
VFAKRARRSVVTIALGILLASCGKMAVWMAPSKSSSAQRTDQAKDADKSFWDTFHQARYDRIQPALEAETAAYLADPPDSITAAHIGWLHFWRLAEASRLESEPATITDDAVLAKKYFEEAVALNPHDARYAGFLASATLIEGSIDHEEKTTRRGYFMLLDAIKQWPEFNLFTAGYVMSGAPAGSKQFKQAIDWEWENLDVCVGEKVDRHTAGYTKYLKQETTEGKKRVCWNSWIAPHNFEGFFLNMGDMLVKAGDWHAARDVYRNAQLSTTYETWPYRKVLEDRIMHAEENAVLFNASKSAGAKYAPIVVNSEFSCTGCHAQ